MSFAIPYCYYDIYVVNRERRLGLNSLSKKELISVIETLLVKVEQLTTRVNNLEEENRLLKVKKTSSNSSMAPSTDLLKAKPNQSLRTKSSKKRGGQSGHKGHTLEMSSTPDIIQKHSPDFCSDCGLTLENTTEFITESRQVIDFPPIIPICTEHQVLAKQCSCGKLCKGQFPVNVNAPIQYGPQVESLVSYLSVRQYLPYKRMQECLSDVFGLQMSQGTIVNMITKFALKATPLYERIKANISESEVVGSDETGAIVNGKKGWFWTWVNQYNTFISFSPSRGFDTIENLFPNGFQSSVLVTDCWAAQLKVPSKAKQLCTAHLSRELNYFIDSLNDQWAIQVKELIQDALKLKKEIVDSQTQNPLRIQLQSRLTKLLEECQLSTNKKVRAFQKRLIKHEDKILTFLYARDIPPDNNASERGIRNVKVKQKVSGQFVSVDKANQFAVIRSVFDTIIKNGQNIFQCTGNIAQLSVPE